MKTMNSDSFQDDVPFQLTMYCALTHTNILYPMN